MKIILVDRGVEASRVIALGRWSRAVLSLCCLGLPLGLVGVGYVIAKSTHVPEALVPLQDEVDAQNEALVNLRVEAERRLQALAMSAAEMEARLLRLDAMGQRLTELAGLDDGEFDFGRSPALGGPLPAGNIELTALNQPLDATQSARLAPSTLASEMGDLEARIADHEQQLDLLQALLSNRQLQDDVFLSGRPIKKGWMSSAFGHRKDPFTGEQVWHQGIDFAGKAGSDVVAVAGGVVTWAGERNGYGAMVEISHGGGYATRYAHNKENLVKAGDIVSKGQVVALMGSSGRSTGPHVHYEVFKNGRPVDPASYVRRTHR
jgi:murein DD-endopeptidase MepM/ murein hydrolase activator NlpD